MSVGDCSQIHEFGLLKEEVYRLLQETLYKMKKKKVETTLHDQKVAKNPIARSVKDIQMSTVCLEKEDSLEKIASEAFYFYFM